ncbi:hypothetical protein J7I98_08045 [Streptomyces sp. ISL-98]|uniref:hypothetical protein n=1 Tax=Streptomyces sp. ISL-98 TaxID=2819192 RepID=UPI001BEC2A5A|nr:hypothetical protein [Streptomyces sp. ISL-98]MBT2505854.1 hypothetical protein [Streptomyces sp. ISL-98]
MQTPDGYGRLKLTKFHTQASQGGTGTPRRTRPAFAMSHSPSTTLTLSSPADEPAAAELVGELERYEDSYRLSYVRGPEGIIVELAEPRAQERPWLSPFLKDRSRTWLQRAAHKRDRAAVKLALRTSSEPPRPARRIDRDAH